MTDAWIYLAVVAVVIWLLVAKIVLPYRTAKARDAQEQAARRAQREKKAAAEAEEENRKTILRERDPQVDPIIASIIKARLALDSIVASIRGDTLSENDAISLKNWLENHSGVAGFPLFKEIRELIAELPNDEHVLQKEDLECFLEDEGLYEDMCLDYADEILGITRDEMLVDGPEEGGRMYEKPSGGYEYVHKRYERILLSVPGTDRGYVYILTNDAMPGLIKIGSTRRNPAKRAETLSEHTGVPLSFTVSYSTVVGNCRLVEKMTHERLDGYRVSSAREFFRISVEDAARVIEDIARGISSA